MNEITMYCKHIPVKHFQIKQILNASHCDICCKYPVKHTQVIAQRNWELNGLHHCTSLKFWVRWYSWMLSGLSEVKHEC